MSDSHVERQVIASEKQRHGRREGFHFAIIAGANVLEDFKYHLVHVLALFCSHKGEESKHLAFVTYMNVVEPLGSSEDFLWCSVLGWNTDNDVIYTNLQVVMMPKEPPAPYFNISDFQNIQCVMQVSVKSVELPMIHVAHTGLHTDSV